MSPREKSSDVSSLTTFVALLRGINVGGRHKLPMADLRRLVEDLGCHDVRSYIQSGNVVFRAAVGSEAAIIQGLERKIETAFDFKVPVVVRNAQQLAQIVAANPYRSLYGDDENKALHVGFLAAEPTAEQIAQLDPQRSPADEFTVLGQEIYLHTPGGLARTKLTNAYFDSKLATTSTVRNWRTTLKLLAMAGQ